MFDPSLADQRVSRALWGVGDAAAGEWFEQGRRGIVHLRRRLTADEAQRGGNLVMTDIRGTAEARARLRAVPGLPEGFDE